jgi:hypothetical protein
MVDDVLTDVRCEDWAVGIGRNVAVSKTPVSCVDE